MCAIRICNTEIITSAILVAFSCLSSLFETKLTFIFPTEGLLFIMELSFSALASKKKKKYFKVLGEKGFSDLTVF